MWTKATTPLDGQTMNCAVWAEDLDEFLVGTGSGQTTLNQQSKMLMGSPDAITWDYRRTPVDDDYDDQSVIPFNWAGAGVYGLARSTLLGRTCAVGSILVTSDFSGTWCSCSVMYSDDQISWTLAGGGVYNTRTSNPWTNPALSSGYGPAGRCIACKQSTGLMIAGGTSQTYGGHAIAGLQKSTDGGVTWTDVPSPFDSAGFGGLAIYSIDYSPGSDTWLVLGFTDSGYKTASSTDDGATWSAFHSLPVGFSANPPLIRRGESSGAWYLLGSATGYKLYKSTDNGATWTRITIDPRSSFPFEDWPPTTAMYDILDIDGSKLSVAGSSGETPNLQMSVTLDGGTTWEMDEDPQPFPDISSSHVPATSFAYSPSIPRAIVLARGVAYGTPAPLRVSVTYDGNGNDSGTAPVDTSGPYRVGDSVTLLDPGDLALTDFEFIAWNSAPDASGDWYYPPGSTFAAPGGDLTLYAIWGTPHSVVYDGNGNDGGTPPTDGSTYTEFSDVTVLDPGDLSLTGEVFSHWNTAPDDGGDSYWPGDTLSMPDADTTLYAIWISETGTVTIMAIRAISNDWEESALDFDTREGFACPPVTLDGNIYSGSVARDFQFVRGDGTKNDPIPTDVAMNMYFYPGGDTSPNDATGSDFNYIAFIIREQKDIPDGIGSHLEAGLQFNDASTTFIAKHVATEGGSPGTETDTGLYSVDLDQVLDPSKNYLFRVQVTGTQIIPTLWEVKIDHQIISLVWQDAMQNSNEAYVNISGRIGFIGSLLSRDAFIDAIDVAPTGFSELVTTQYVSRTPVDGAQLSAVYSPDMNLYTSISGGTLVIDPTKTISGNGSYRATGALTTNSFIVNDWTQMYLDLAIWVSNAITDANQPQIVLNIPGGTTKTLPVSGLKPSQWNLLHFDLGIFRDLISATNYSFTIQPGVNPDKPLGFYWVDSLAIGRRRVSWSARATSGGLWREFKEVVNNPHGALHFTPEERGTHLQLKAAALTEDAWVSSFYLFPRYASLGLPLFDQGGTYESYAAGQ